jgi:hypothetical protein
MEAIGRLCPVTMLRISGAVPPHVLMACCWTKQKDVFTFTFTIFRLWYNFFNALSQYVVGDN